MSSPAAKVSPVDFGFFLLVLICLFLADPGKQFALVAQHISMLRQIPGRTASRVMIYVERNLGFEAGESPPIFIVLLVLHPNGHLHHQAALRLHLGEHQLRLEVKFEAQVHGARGDSASPVGPGREGVAGA